MNLGEANKILFERYLGILEASDDYGFDIEETSREHLIKMCKTAVENIISFPTDKSSRWLWYIQWIMVCQKLIDVSEERDFSRTLFHKVYKDSGIDIPKTIDLNNNWNHLWN